MEAVQRVLQLFLIKPGERAQLGYFFIVFLILGAGLALGRGSADALFFKRYGIENLPAIYAMLAVVLGFGIVIYASWADQLSSERFLLTLTGILIAILFLCWQIMRDTGSSAIYPAYYMVFELASELLPLHFMLYIGQNFETLQAKRLMPVIFAGAQLGRMAGGVALAGIGPAVGMDNILLLWIALLAAVVVIVARRHRRVGMSPYYRGSRRSRQRWRRIIGQLREGVAFARESALVRAASWSLFFLVLTYYILNYAVNKVYIGSFPTEAELGRFFGLLAAGTSMLALFIQLFVTSRLVEAFGVKRINLVFPVSNLLVFGGLLLTFALPAAIVASISKDALMPAIRNPTRSLFFNILPDRIQGRARALSMAVLMPAGLALAGGLLYLVQQLEHIAYVLGAGAAAGVFYFFFNTRMNRAYGDTVLQTLRERVFVESEDNAAGNRDIRDAAFRQELEQGVRQPDDEIAVTCAELLMKSSPASGVDLVVRRLGSAGNPARDRLVRLIAEYNTGALWTYYNALPGDADNHLRATILLSLFDARLPEARETVAGALQSSNFRLAAAGIAGVYCYRLASLEEDAGARLRAMLADEQTGARLAALDVLARFPDTGQQHAVLQALRYPSDRVRLAALQVLERWPDGAFPGLGAVLFSLYDSTSHQIRWRAVLSSRMLELAERQRLLTLALEDSHPRVQKEAVRLLFGDDAEFCGVAVAWIQEHAGSPRAEATVLATLAARGVPLSTMRDIAAAKAQYALKLHQAINTLRRATPASNWLPSPYRLLFTVLRERLDQVIDLALSALKGIEGVETINVVRAGLRSGDRRQTANAREALCQLREANIAMTLEQVLRLEERDMAARPPRSATLAEIRQMLAWCRTIPDTWMRECVRYAEVAGPEVREEM
jgi:hypothetical protein